MEEEWRDKVVAWLKEGKYPDNFDEVEKTKKKGMKVNWRRACFGFRVVDHDVLEKKLDDDCWVRVVMAAERDDVLHAMHDGNTSGHFGQNKTFARLASQFWWKSMRPDVRQYVENCDVCQRHNTLRKGTGELHPVKFHDRVFAMWGMDLVGPLTETPEGHRYIMVCMNYLARWAEATAIKDKSAESVAEVLVSLICRFGVPERVVSDQGREFCNQLNDRLLAKLGVKRSICSAYHPQSNGLTERANQTLCTVLAKMANEKQTDWDRNLKWAVFAYNTAEQASLKETPFCMVYGVQARLPNPLAEDDLHDDASLSSIVSEDNKLADLVERRMQSITDLEEVRAIGKKNIEAAQQNQKAQYDAKHKGFTYEVGDKVLYFNGRKATRKGSKMDPVWLGPRLIEEILPNGGVRLQGMKQLRNSKQLKVYKEKMRDNGLDDTVSGTHQASSVEGSPDVLPMSKRRCVDASQLKCTRSDTVGNQYYFKPPTESWQKSTCEHFGLLFKKRSALRGTVTGAKFGVRKMPTRVASIKGDGNCLFRCISYFVTGEEEQHEQIRRIICEHLIADGRAQYVNESGMMDLREWGGSDELLAAAQLFNVSVFTAVVWQGTPIWQVLPSAIAVNKRTDYVGFYLDNRCNTHFEVVLSIGR